jgi:hypothetical protein
VVFTQEKIVDGKEKARVRRFQKEKAKRRREDEKWEAEQAMRRKLAGRERGHSNFPQIITHETAERWKAENRVTKNRIAVAG